MNDEAVILKKLDRMSELFVHPDLELFEELFTEDVDYITFNGQHLKGIRENLAVHQQLANLKIFRGAGLFYSTRQIKFVNADTAIAIITGGIKFRWQKTLSRKRLSINTNVLVRQSNGDWKIASFQNSRIKTPGLLQRLFSR